MTPVLRYAALGFCLLAAGLALYTAIDSVRYIPALLSTKLAYPPHLGRLIAPLIVCVLLIPFAGLSAWQLRRQSAAQLETLRDWSAGAVLLWGGLYLYLFLLNYPIPPQAHHLDKFVILVSLALLWSMAFLLLPHRLRQMLASRLYRFIKILAVNLVLFVLAGEIILRIADPLLARGGLFGDKHTPAALIPHAEVLGSIGRTNSQGFRDRERSFEKSDGVHRILALGDSFTWGSGVTYDETFVTLVEQGLNGGAHPTEVINLGVPAWGPHEEFHLLTVYGIRFHPDRVILNFFIGNDIQNKRGDDFNLPEPVIVAGQSYYVHRNGNWVHDTLGPGSSFLYHNLNYLVKVGGSRLRAASEEGLLAGERLPLLSRTDYVRGIRERNDIYLIHDTPFFSRHWDRTQKTLVAMKEFLAERDIPLIVVMLPEQVQFDTGLQREYFQATGASPTDYDFYKPQRLLLAWCHEQHVQCIDLWPAFAAAGDPAGLHFRNDIHWSERGHRLAAETILSALGATPK